MLPCMHLNVYASPVECLAAVDYWQAVCLKSGCAALVLHMLALESGELSAR